MPRCLAALILLLLAGCAATPAPPPVQMAATPPEAARANVVSLLPGYSLTRVERAVAPNMAGEVEGFRYANGFVIVTSAFSGSRLTQDAMRTHGDAAEIEAWARGTARQQGALLSTTRLDHVTAPGRGFLLTFAGSAPGTSCSTGRGFYALRGGTDGSDPVHDTTLTAVFCHPATAPVPRDITELARRLAVR